MRSDEDDGNIVVFGEKRRKKSINDNNDVDHVLVSQLLIKATYFLYWFNYLFSDVKLCVLYERHDNRPWQGSKGLSI